uniref:Uncharacterized protein n=1 Tax=Anguilla anguilla TaxID=7936 RepID=A0A0E9WEY0_ANGAN
MPRSHWLKAPADRARGQERTEYRQETLSPQHKAVFMVTLLLLISFFL